MESPIIKQFTRHNPLVVEIQAHIKASFEFTVYSSKIERYIAPFKCYYGELEGTVHLSVIGLIIRRIMNYEDTCEVMLDEFDTGWHTVQMNEMNSLVYKLCRLNPPSMESIYAAIEDEKKQWLGHHDSLLDKRGRQILMKIAERKKLEEKMNWVERLAQSMLRRHAAELMNDDTDN